MSLSVIWALIDQTRCCGYSTTLSYQSCGKPVQKQSKFVTSHYDSRKKADASGYSNAMRYLLSMVDIQCAVVLGEADGQSHTCNANSRR